MDNLLLGLETEFYFFTGLYLEGISGLFLGLFFFSLLLIFFRYERRPDPLITNVDISNDIGNEKVAKINLSRSLIEMDQTEEARKLLTQVLENSPSDKEKETVHQLLKKINN